MLCKYEKQITITRIMLGTPLSNQSLRLEISANLYILKPGSDFCDFLFSNFSFIRFHKDLIYIYFWKVIIEEFSAFKLLLCIQNQMSSCKNMPMLPKFQEFKAINFSLISGPGGNSQGPRDPPPTVSQSFKNQKFETNFEDNLNLNCDPIAKIKNVGGIPLAPSINQ